MKVGFIGLGGIGKPMAINVARAGFELTVCDLREGPVNELTTLGATAAASPREVATSSDIVLASLPSNEASIEVALGPKGVLAGTEPGDIYIELSTISPEVVQRIGSAARDVGVDVIDAPVSGGIAQREAGTLSVMAGGESAPLERARPVLQAFGERIFHTGGPGTGATVKLINNMLAGINMIATMEAMALGAKSGLTVDTLREVIRASSGNSGLFAGLVENIMTVDPQPQPGELASQGLHTIGKDVQLAVELAQAKGVPLVLGSPAAQVFTSGLARGWAEQEYWSIMQIFEEMSAIQVRPIQY
ncbi:MAG: tRNA methyltransferase [Gammaproteobacteria bacterium]|nr:tRNA methyltransferase [Gammaproteobacteria bacterium]